MADPTDQMLDILEDLVIENRVLVAAIGAAKKHLPEAAQQEIDRFVQQALSDPKQHSIVEDDVQQYRNQSLERTVEQLRKKYPKKD